MTVCDDLVRVQLRLHYEATLRAAVAAHQRTSSQLAPFDPPTASGEVTMIPLALAQAMAAEHEAWTTYRQAQMRYYAADSETRALSNVS